MKDSLDDIFEFLADIYTRYSAQKAISIAAAMIKLLSAGNWFVIKNGLLNDKDFIELIRGKEMVLSNEEEKLLKEALETHPEAVNDIEAADLLSVDAHGEAMKTQAHEEEKFQEHSLRYTKIRMLYKKLLNDKTSPHYNV